MEAWIRIEEVTDQPFQLAVDFESDHTIADLLGAIEVFISTDLGPMMLKRTSQEIVPSATVVESGLRIGDTLLPFRVEARHDPSTNGCRVVIAGGPGAGNSLHFSGDSMVIGRSAAADLTLADATVSTRHASITRRNQSYTVDDLDSLNGSFINGDSISDPTALGPGSILEIGDFALRLVLDDILPFSPRVADGRVQFTRGPRLGPPPAAVVFEIPAPPEDLQKRRLSLASALIPLAMAPILVAVTGQTSYLAMAALSPVMAIGSVVEDRRHGRRDHGKRARSFHESVAATTTAMADNQRSETAARWARFPDPADILRRSIGPAGDLWERRLTDSDALELRLAWGDLPSNARWSMADGGSTTLRDEAAAKLVAYGVVRSAPMTVNLQSSPVVGLVGDDLAAEETARWLVIQAAVLHSPRDLSLAFALGTDRAAHWAWAHWLPHTGGQWLAAEDLDTDPLAVGEDAARRLILSLNNLVSRRQLAKRTRDEESDSSSHVVVVVVDERLRIPRSAFAAILEQGPALGIRVLWLGGRVDQLPGETSAIAASRDTHIDVTAVADGSQVRDLQRDRCSLELATTVAYALAGIRDASARSGRTAELPNLVTLSDVLGGPSTPTAMVERWAVRDNSLGGPIGYSEGGLFSVDLRQDGPHALLGGTTGAGKSEMLQTIVASLAATHAPTRLTFLLVDYKGGAAFKDCVRLPHVVGLVTDLSGHLVRRALVSLNAEVHRREHLLAAAGVKDIIEMEWASPTTAPANLLVVIDEFATLAKELPEFVDGVVNVAQRGRSLGVHMLLATQRPAGAINDNIRANTNLRMALRMNDAADSSDVIGSPVAASLPRTLPGRVFVKTGASEMTQVQVAYSGARTPAADDHRELVVLPLDFGRTGRPGVDKKDQATDAPTDLQLVVQSAIEAAMMAELPTMPSPWLPPLGAAVCLTDLKPPRSPTTAAIGTMDQPERQAQSTLGIDLATEGSMLILGTSGAGKTTLLRTVALSLAQRNTPDTLHLYALDFASRGLKGLEALPHCGAVITSDEVDRVQRAFSLFDRWMTERKRRFAEVRASSLSEYQRLAPAGQQLARIVVLIDSYGGFASTFENVDYGARLEQLPRLVGEGASLGLHFIITASRRNAVPTSLASLIQTSIVLRLADVEDYAAAGLDPKIAKGAVLPPGRGFRSPGSVEVQCAVVSQEHAGDAQQAVFVRTGADLARRWPNLAAPAIETLPSHTELAPLLGLSRPMRPVIGLSERDLAPMAVDLSEGHLLVAGPLRSGKSTTLAAIVSGLRRADPSLDIILIAPRRTPLTALDGWSSVARQAAEIDEKAEHLQRFVSEAGVTQTRVLVIDDGEELLEGSIASTLESLVRTGRDNDLCVVAAVDVNAAHRAYGGWISELKKDRMGLLIQPDTTRDGDLFGIQLPRLRTAPPGRGFLVSRNGAEGLQIGFV
jgi:DNA segregation ATPase FtsK/SpoIIIE, S-DNA-T family